MGWRIHRICGSGLALAIALLAGAIIAPEQRLIVPPTAPLARWERAVQRARYMMTLETIAPLGDDPLVSLPAQTT
jgi:hypothetical protein